MYRGPAAGDEISRFLNIFAQACESNGSVYMTDSWSARRADICDKMKLRQMHMPANRFVEEPGRDECFQALLQAVNPSNHMHGKLYQTQYEQVVKDQADHSAAPFFADWEQNPSKGKSHPSALVPCFLTHGTLVEHRSGKCLTLKELYSVHGWGTLRDDCYRSNVLDLISQVFSSGKISPKTAAKTFIGNSMHVPSVLAVLLYGLSHCVRKSSVETTAWIGSRRSSSFNFEIGGGSGSASANDTAVNESSEGSGLKGSPKGRGRGRGRANKRQADAAAEDDEADGALGFKRGKSCLFDE